MKQSLGLKMGQSLTMTPALQQAIRMLQLSSLDLQQEIQQVLDSNVMLELDAEETVEPEPGTPEAPPAEAPVAEVKGDAEITAELPVDADWSDVYDEPATSKSSAPDDPELQDFLQANLHAGPTLREHLLEQLRLAPFDSPLEAEIALHIVDSVNDDGYLENWGELLEALRSTLGASDDQIDDVLKTVQEFDPAGVAARNLCECLRLQLLAIPLFEAGRGTAMVLVEQHLALLARRDAAQVSKITGLAQQDVEEGMELIRQLQPHPGRPFQAHESSYVAPDVFVTKRAGRWKVSLNPEHMPRLRINNYYQSLVK
ncbi:MAG TPA: RNA polymerase factor sigma-54, partial [Solimonas sp.]|nr:RNA polymerase factor sigma-54 [Solimonas sp.]